MPLHCGMVQYSTTLNIVVRTGILRDAPSLRRYGRCGGLSGSGRTGILRDAPSLRRNWIPNRRPDPRGNGHPPGCPFIAAGKCPGTALRNGGNGHPPGCPFIAADEEVSGVVRDFGGTGILRDAPSLRHHQPTTTPMFARGNGHPPGCPFIAARTTRSTGVRSRCERASSGMPLHCGRGPLRGRFLVFP